MIGDPKYSGKEGVKQKGGRLMSFYQNFYNFLVVSKIVNILLLISSYLRRCILIINSSRLSTSHFYYFSAFPYQRCFITTFLREDTFFTGSGIPKREDETGKWVTPFWTIWMKISVSVKLQWVCPFPYLGSFISTFGVS